jgi:dTMP kinase
MAEGVFIAIEGIDGAGVTTQAELLQRKLEDDILPFIKEDVEYGNGPHTHLTKEPTDGPAGGQIRVALSERLELDTETLALFFATDRRDHVEREIEPMLEDGYIVIADRYYLSSYAYQLDGVGGDLEWLRAINSKSISPDLTILLDVEVDTSERRRDQSRLTEELTEDRETLETVRENYLDIADTLQSEGENIRIVDGEGDAEREVFQSYRDYVYDLLQEKNYATIGTDG